MAAGQPTHGTVPSTTVDIGPQLAPPSVDRRITSAWCFPSSPQLSIRFSANASRLPVPAQCGPYPDRVTRTGKKGKRGKKKEKKKEKKRKKRSCAVRIVPGQGYPDREKGKKGKKEGKKRRKKREKKVM